MVKVQIRRSATSTGRRQSSQLRAKLYKKQMGLSLSGSSHVGHKRSEVQEHTCHRMHPFGLIQPNPYLGTVSAQVDHGANMKAPTQKEATTCQTSSVGLGPVQSLGCIFPSTRIVHVKLTAPPGCFAPDRYKKPSLRIHLPQRFQDLAGRLSRPWEKIKKAKHDLKVTQGASASKWLGHACNLQVLHSMQKVRPQAFGPSGKDRNRARWLVSLGVPLQQP